MRRRVSEECADYSKEAPQLKFITHCVHAVYARKPAEDAITLAPACFSARRQNRGDIDGAAFCVALAKPFGTRQMIDNMVGRLSGHSMFADPAALRRLQMCADCRVLAMMEEKAGASIFDFPTAGPGG